MKLSGVSSFGEYAIKIHSNLVIVVVLVFESEAKVATFREKSGNFLKSQGKSLILSKSVKGQVILFSGL